VLLDRAYDRSLQAIGPEESAQGVKLFIDLVPGPAYTPAMQATHEPPRTFEPNHIPRQITTGPNRALRDP